MEWTPEAIGEEGVLACARQDRDRVTMLLRDLIGALDLGDGAALAMCRVYEVALADVRAGRFLTAREIFQALRET